MQMDQPRTISTGLATLKRFFTKSPGALPRPSGGTPCERPYPWRRSPGIFVEHKVLDCGRSLRWWSSILEQRRLRWSFSLISRNSFAAFGGLPEGTAWVPSQIRRPPEITEAWDAVEYPFLAGRLVDRRRARAK